MFKKKYKLVTEIMKTYLHHIERRCENNNTIKSLVYLFINATNKLSLHKNTTCKVAC